MVKILKHIINTNTMKKALLILVLVLMLVLGCVQHKPPVSETQKVKIGVLVPSTGKFSTSGIAMKNAAELALKHIKEYNLTKYDIELEFADCGDNPEKAKSAFVSLVSKGVIAVVGGYSSPQVLAIADSARDTKTVYIATVGSTLALEKKIAEGNKYVFRNAYNTTYWGILAAEFLNISKPENYYFVGYEPLKTFNSGMLKAIINKTGINPKEEIYYKSPSASPNDYKIKANDLAKKVGSRDVVILGDPGPISVKFLKEYRGVGGKGIVYSVGGVLALPTVLKNAKANYTAFQAAALEQTPKTKFTKKYFEDYRKTYGKEANNYAALLTYDSILILAQAIEKSGLNKDKLIKTLETEEFVGAAGYYKFVNHQATWGSEKLRGVIAEYVGNVQILYPKEFATSKVIWPE